MCTYVTSFATCIPVSYFFPLPPASSKWEFSSVISPNFQISYYFYEKVRTNVIKGGKWRNMVTEGENAKETSTLWLVTMATSHLDTLWTLSFESLDFPFVKPVSPLEQERFRVNLLFLLLTFHLTHELASFFRRINIFSISAHTVKSKTFWTVVEETALCVI